MLRGRIGWRLNPILHCAGLNWKLLRNAHSLIIGKLSKKLQSEILQLGSEKLQASSKTKEISVAKLSDMRWISRNIWEKATGLKPSATKSLLAAF